MSWNLKCRSDLWYSLDSENLGYHLAISRDIPLIFGMAKVMQYPGSKDVWTKSLPVASRGSEGRVGKYDAIKAVLLCKQTLDLCHDHRYRIVRRVGRNKIDC